MRATRPIIQSAPRSRHVCSLSSIYLSTPYVGAETRSRMQTSVDCFDWFLPPATKASKQQVSCKAGFAESGMSEPRRSGQAIRCSRLHSWLLGASGYERQRPGHFPPTPCLLLLACLNLSMAPLGSPSYRLSAPIWKNLDDMIRASSPVAGTRVSMMCQSETHWTKHPPARHPRTHGESFPRAWRQTAHNGKAALSSPSRIPPIQASSDESDRAIAWACRPSFEPVSVSFARSFEGGRGREESNVES